MIARSFIIIFTFFFCYINLYSAQEHLHSSSQKKPAAQQVWTCAMHPQIKSNKPGKCPICSMDLIPLESTNSIDSPSNTVIKLSDRARKLAEVQTATVKREAVFAEILLTGTLDYDETMAAEIVSHFPGRVEKLYANYTGMHVKKGSHLAKIFSSDLYVYQREILITYNTLLKAEKTGNKASINNAEQQYINTQNKMRVMGLTNEQVQQIIKKGTISDTLDLYSPIDGVVIKKNIVQGQHFKSGDPLFVISNLNKLWLMLDAYELDLPFIRYGQKVEFNVEAVPGKKFSGKIVYIDPILNSKTRASKVRVVVDNKDELLKPGMFVRATAFVQLGEKGVVMAESLKDKWISPMHPQILKDHPGKCDICGMDLVPAESLGLIKKNDSNTASLPLVIPDSAPLITGKRAVVYIELEPGTYEAKNIVLGPKVGKQYLVYSGLKEGDRIVSRGSFKIDSELQIKSTNAGMMSQFSTQKDDTEKPTAAKTINSENNQTVLIAISDFYFDIQKTLSEDDLKYAVKSADLFSKYLTSLNINQTKSFESKSGVKVSDLLQVLNTEKLNESISEARKFFYRLTRVIALFMKHLEHITGKKTYRYDCTMAFNNKGAYWFQDVKKIANPYFGNAMKSCGFVLPSSAEK